MSCVLCAAEPTELIDLEGAKVSAPLCDVCASGLNASVDDKPHWQCLHDAIWSADGTTQIVAHRVLSNLHHAPWARDLLEIAYLEPDLLAAAQNVQEPALIHRDSNGAILNSGDTVVLIKDLPVKGAGFTAKRGTAVRNISLVHDNAGHIEGRVESQRIVILTEFVKKS